MNLKIINCLLRINWNSKSKTLVAITSKHVLRKYAAAFEQFHYHFKFSRISCRMNSVAYALFPNKPFNKFPARTFVVTGGLCDSFLL